MATKTHHGSEVLKEQTYYLPTYFRDDKGPVPTGECTLLLRHFRLVKTRAGKLRIHIKNDGRSFSNAGEMVTAIETERLRGLPIEAESDRHYLPKAFRVEGATIAS
jgi:hypothetical protein